RLLLLGGRELLVLHDVEAADVLGDLGELDREVEIALRQAVQDLAHHALVLLDERPLPSAMRRLVEEVERGMAQELQVAELGQQLEDPAVDRELLDPARRRVAGEEELRRQMELQLVAPLELGLELAPE